MDARDSLDQAKAGDAGEIFDLREAAAHWLVGRGIPQWRPGEMPLAAIQAQVAAEEWWLCRTARGLVAAVRVIDSDPLLWNDATQAGYIHGLMIRRAEAGTGLGERVLTAAESLIKTRGYGVARLDCVRTNGRLRSYYLDRGYEERGEVEFGENSPWSPVVRFEKRLTESP